VGCEARKTPADAELFFLDFPFNRTYQELMASYFGDAVILPAAF
jgi:hypothetical protein